MSVLPFLAVSLGFGAASLLTRRYSGYSFAIGLVGLAVAAAAALWIAPGDSMEMADGAIVGSAFQRTFLALACTCSLLLCLLSMTGGWHPDLAGASLIALGAGGAALALGEPVAAITATIAAGLFGVLVTVSFPVTARAVNIGARELRAVAIAGVLGLLAAAWVDRPLGPLAAEPVVLGLSYLAIAMGVAIRFGAIPFHVWAARVADAAPELALPLLMAWGPSIFAVVGLAWLNNALVPLAPAPLALPLERALVVGVAVVTLLLGAFAAWIQEDIEHVVAYSIVQDAAFVILAFAALDGASWGPALTWIVVFVLAKSAFAAWALAVRRRFGTRRLRDLRGWSRRTPLLTLALVVIAVATIGFPGVAAYESRMALIRLTSDGPFRWVLTFGAVCAVAYYARLLAVGIATPGPAVLAAEDDRPRWPDIPVRETSGAWTREAPLRVEGDRKPVKTQGADAQARSRDEAVGPWAIWVERGERWFERGRRWLATARRTGGPRLRAVGERSRRSGTTIASLARTIPPAIVPAIELNQAFIAAALVLTLSLMALVGALGGWGTATIAADGPRLISSVGAAK
jgi:NADH:ubiquinone oxidoreductase subunit 2 (subunit N)